MTERTTILIVDDERIIREDLALNLPSRIEKEIVNSRDHAFGSRRNC